MDQAQLVREVHGTHIEILLLALRENRDATREELSEEARYDAKEWLVERGLTTGEESLANEVQLPRRAAPGGCPGAVAIEGRGPVGPGDEGPGGSARRGRRRGERDRGRRSGGHG